MNADALLLMVAPGFPAALTVLVLVPAARATLFRLLPIAPLPALAAALLLPVGTEQPLPDALLGAGLALDGIGRTFLGVAALLWALAGLYSVQTIRGERSKRFAGFWLASLTGNLLLFVAADVVSFYLAFSLLSLSAFGLIIHAGTAEARHAGRVYLVLAVFGETCLLIALLIGAEAANSVLIGEVRDAIIVSPHRDLALAMFVVGLGLKAGLVPLHVWLPLAHPAAPVGASAVLSGAIVKAGIFGLSRFLPLEAELPGWSAGLVTLGLATAFLGVLFGLLQHRPKTVLAYSTLSQMGLIVVVLGTGFGSPDAGSVLAAATLYSAHHSLTKGALFLSVGVYKTSARRQRGPIMLATALTALAIAGLPLTGGALAKLAIKDPLGEGPAALLVTISAVGTTLLMLHFLRQLRRMPLADGDAHPRLLLSFLLCVTGALAVPWMLMPRLTKLTAAHATDAANISNGLWPVLLGSALILGLLALPIRTKMIVPEGDIIVPVERLFHRLERWMQLFARSWKKNKSAAYWKTGWKTDRFLTILVRAEQKVAQWQIASVLLLSIGLIISVLMAQ